MSSAAPKPRARGVWIALSALVAATLLSLWHVLVLQLWQDTPFRLAALLVVLFGLLAFAGVAARRVPGARRGFAARLASSLEGPGLAFVALGLVLVFLFHWGFERAASDGREYFVQVRSLVIDGDLDFANENATFGTRGTARRYAFGAPLLWAPFFLACHLWLGLLNLLGAEFVREGYSVHYQRAVGVATLAYGIAGLALVFAVLKNYFTRWLAFLTTAVLCLGSFITWYLVVENSMVHGASMFATTLFFYTWHRSRHRDLSTGNREPRAANWIAMAATAGLMTLVRWQNGAFVVLPAVEIAWRSWRALPGTAAERLRGLAPRAAFAAAVGLAAFFPQFLFWKLVYGNWWNLPANEHGVRWTSLAMGDVLFSSNHGLVSSTPLLFLALLGVPLFLRRDRWLTAALAFGFIAQLYVNSTVEVWWGGAGYGGRRFANCALVFAVGLASLLEWLRERPLAAPMAMLAGLLALNAAVMLDVRGGRWPSTDAITWDEMTSALYEKLGHPFQLPLSAIVAGEYDVGMPFYDRLRGRTYNNLEIDIGSAGDERYLGRGWAARERNPDMTFRWASAREAIVVVPVKESDDYRLELRAAPFTYPDAPPQAVNLFVNGSLAGRLEIGPGMAWHTFEIPAALIGPNLNQFAFRFAHAASPASVRISDDTRPLAVVFDTIRLTRLLRQAPR